jgi:hypothetical protein
MTGELTLSGLNLLMKTSDPVTGARIHALGDDMTLGDPEAVIATFQSQLQDGDLENHSRDGNREAKIPLVIDAPDAGSPGDALAGMAAALDAACRFDGWTELVYTSPLDGSEPSVYEVTSASVSATFDDRAEIQQGCRYVTLTLHARPFARPADPISIDAPAAVGSTTTSVDSGSATTGWSMLSTAPSAITNLVTDPAFVVGITGWSAGAGTTAVTWNSPYVSSALNIQGSNSGGNAYATSPRYTVVAGTRYYFGLTHITSGYSCGFLYRWYNASDVQIGPDASVAGTVSGSRAFSANAVAPAGATGFRIFPFITKVFSSGLGQWFGTGGVDNVYVTDGDLGFFYGATTDTAVINYAWTGTVNASTSTATWTAPALAVVSGGVQATVYGRASASDRRNNTGITSAAMATVPYIRIRGTASAFSDGQITIADNGGVALATTSYSYNSTTGAYDILIKRAAGFANLDITFARTGGAVSTTSGVFVNVDQIDITDNPFASAKVQTRQVTIYGSQRTELSLSVLGLDAAGTTPVGLGEQILVHTASAGSDGRAKFLACRSASGLAGTADATAVSGVFNALSTTATPTNFAFAASALLSGNYLAVARGRSATVGANTLSFRAFIDPTVGDNAFDPRTGWKTAPLTVVASGALWPQVNQASGSPASPWALIPLGMLRLPPADIEDAGATITVQLARGANAVDVDEVFLLNADADVGQASILLTGLTSGSYSAVRLDAATVDSPQATAWVGAANGTMLADAARWIGEQHAAAPGLLQISTVTPGCATSRVSARYYPRFHTHVATVDAA